MSHRTTRTLAVALLSASTWAAPALAQDEAPGEPTEAQLEQARATFMEGVELTQQEEWAEAAARFRAVLEVRSTPQVQFNLGFALAHLEGHLAEAADLLQAAAASGELDRRTRRNAESELDRIEPSLGRMIVRLTGDEAGVEVQLDGQPFGLDRMGQSVRVDPGTHELVSSRDGETLGSQTVEIVAGETANVSLTGVVEPIIDPELLHHEEPSEDEGGDVTGEWWFWTAIIGGAALIGAGVVIGVVVASDGSVQPFSGNLEPGTLEIMP